MAERAVIRADELQTPRSVWATSAIAAGLLHGLLLWWGLAAWQGRRANVVEPTPIRLVTLSDDAIPALPPPTSNPDNAAPSEFVAPSQESSPGGSNPSRPAAASPTTAPRDLDRRLTPVPPPARPPAQTLSPSPTNPVAPSPPIAPSPSPAPPPPVSPTPPQSASPPVQAPPAAAPPPPTPSAPPGNPEGAPPNSPPPTAPPNPPNAGGGSAAPLDHSGAPAASRGVQSWWSLQPVPGGGSDIHDQIPQMPSGWQAATARLLTEAGCAADALAPGTSVRLTLWPAVDAQGRIFEFLPWEGDNSVPAAVRQCVTALRSQLPPLLPAQDGGQPIASDEVLLVIELRSTP